MTIKRDVTICNKRGLHARAAAKFVTLARTYDCDIVVHRDGEEAPGSSIMDLLMLAAGPGTAVTLTAQGPDAEEALKVLGDLVECGFEEDD